jgi:uncharacterized protein YjeT (DUF2065 family)
MDFAALFECSAAQRFMLALDQIDVLAGLSPHVYPAVIRKAVIDAYRATASLKLSCRARRLSADGS